MFVEKILLPLLGFIALLIVGGVAVLAIQLTGSDQPQDDVNLSNNPTVSTKGFDVHVQNYHPKPLNTVGRPA